MMSQFCVVLTAALLLPSLALCGYPWPDNVTQHKGYIVVRVYCTRYYSSIPSTFAVEQHPRGALVLLVL